MDKRARRRKRKNAIRETMDMVKTILLIVMAVFVVAFVFLFIRQQLNAAGGGEDSKISVFGSLFSKDEESTAAETEAESTDVEIKTELTEGLNRSADGKLFFVKDGAILKDCWVDHKSALYRVDKDGYAVTGNLEEDGFVYSFSAQGEVSCIDWNENVQAPAENAEYPGLVQSGSLMVYLNESDKLGRFSRIIYKKSTVSHQLGGEDNPQYTRKGSIQIGSDGYIYWLPVAADPDEMEAHINRNLYRMQPDAQKRQIVAEGVDGYRVLTGENGETVIYYCRRGSMYRCGSANCKDDESVFAFTEDMEYVLDLSVEGKLYLKTVSGYPVTMETDAFTTGGMTYQLSKQGEILGVKEDTKVNLGEEGTWTVLSDDLFGTKRSVVVWEDEEGVQSAISTEFTGECGNMYLCPKDMKFYAEYKFSDGTPRIVAITKDGDVDLLLGSNANAVSIKIMGFKDDDVVVQNTDSSGRITYECISKEETSPIAVGIEPVLMEEQDADQGSSSIEHLGPGYASSPVGPGMTVPSGDSSSIGPGYSSSPVPGSTSGSGSSAGFGPGSSTGNPPQS